MNSLPLLIVVIVIRIDIDIVIDRHPLWMYMFAMWISLNPYKITCLYIYGYKYILYTSILWCTYIYIWVCVVAYNQDMIRLECPLAEMCKVEKGNHPQRREKKYLTQKVCYTKQPKNTCQNYWQWRPFTFFGGSTSDIVFDHHQTY